MWPGTQIKSKTTIITRFLGWDDEWEHIKAFLPKFTETAMAPHSSAPAWKIPWTDAGAW